MIALKSRREIDILRENGKLLAEILDELCAEAEDGQTTAYLDRLAERRVRESGGEPAFSKFAGFPGTINASLNDEVVHGVPSEERTLREGDVFSIDTVSYTHLRAHET